MRVLIKMENEELTMAKRGNEAERVIVGMRNRDFIINL